MGVKKVTQTDSPRRQRPATTPEARENQLIASSYDEAERRIADHTASDTLLITFLKMGATRERLEKEKLEEENKLLRAKTEAYESSKNSEQMFAEAIKAFTSYRGNNDESDEDV